MRRRSGSSSLYPHWMAVASRWTSGAERRSDRDRRTMPLLVNSEMEAGRVTQVALELVAESAGLELYCVIL